MPMTNDQENSELDAFLASLKHAEPDAPSALLGRVLDDAYALQPVPEAIRQVPPEAPRWEVLSVFGGWGGLGGLALAASVGFFAGFNPPALLQERLPFLAAGDVFDLDADVSGFGWDLEEDAS